MKTLISAAWGLEDGPEPGYDNRTPIDLARLTALNRLAAQAQAGQARYGRGPRDSQVAGFCLSLLGYDPAQLHGGTAPIEILAYGASLKPYQVVLRMDLVTLENGRLAAPTRATLQEGESQAFCSELKARLEDDKVTVLPAEGGRLFVVVDDALLWDELCALELPDPKDAVGRPYPSVTGRSEAAALIDRIRVASEVCLEKHEINRVRIDLGENPCNGVWIWGNGKPADLPSLRSRGWSRALFTGTDPMLGGLARALGADLAQTVEPGRDDYDLVLAVTVHESLAADLKERIRRIEQWDADTGVLAAMHPARLIAAYTLQSAGKRRPLAKDRFAYLDGRTGGVGVGAAADALAAVQTARGVLEGHVLLKGPCGSDESLFKGGAE